MMQKRPVVLFLLLAVNFLTDVSKGRSLKGCANSVRSLSSTSHQKSHRDDVVVKVLKKSSLQDDCEDNEDASSPASTDKNKIKSLQTNIHKNLLKLFHKLKSAKPGSVMPDRKEFTNFPAQPNPNGKPDDQVSTGVPLSKVRDGIKNVSKLQDINSTSTLKALDKLVDTVLPNVSTVLNNSNNQRAEDFEGGSGSAMEPKELNKTDPYAAIAAGPDHPKLPPDLKITPGGSDGEAPPVVPVGMSDDSKSGKGGDDESHGPTPEEPNEAPSQEEDKDGSEEPDNPMVKQMQAQAMQVIQEQMQDQFKSAMQAAKGMPGGMGGIGGMGGMGGMGSMGNMGSMGGMQSMGGMGGGMNGGMNGGMGGGMDSMGGMGGMDMGGMGEMGGMAGFGGMGDMGMAGMYGNRMAELGEMDSFDNNAYQRDILRGNRGYFNGGNPFYTRGFGRGLRSPIGPMYPMMDEPAVGRDKVPLGYEDQERMPYVRPFRTHRYFGNEEDFDDDIDGDNYDEPYFVPARERAAFEEPFDVGPENEMDDGYDAPYERKTTIPTVEKPKRKDKIKHNSHKTSKGVKNKVTVTSKKDKTEKRGKATGKRRKQ